MRSEKVGNPRHKVGKRLPSAPQPINFMAGDLIAKSVMRKRWLWIAGPIVGLVAMAAILLLLIDRRPGPGVTPENFNRLCVGMPQADAEAILGRKADWGARTTDNVYLEWREGDDEIHLFITYLYGDGPTLSQGQMRLADGTTMNIHPEAANYYVWRALDRLGWK
jgi:hypothetical protein